jgi:hypothetical protein
LTSAKVLMARGEWQFLWRVLVPGRLICLVTLVCVLPVVGAGWLPLAALGWVKDSGALPQTLGYESTIEAAIAEVVRLCLSRPLPLPHFPPANTTVRPSYWILPEGRARSISEQSTLFGRGILSEPLMEVMMPMDGLEGQQNAARAVSHGTTTRMAGAWRPPSSTAITHNS